jgi:tRNA nucleotidyltransferase (CCA-adding enzyme)
MERLDEGERAWLARLGEVAADAGARAWLVGGPVRDLILGERAPDTDLAIEGDVAAVAEAIAREVDGRVSKSTEFLTATVTLAGGEEIDIAHTRTERYDSPGALPVVTAARLVEDLARRDFTINAMALALSPERFGELTDPHGGREDLERGLLRVLHEGSFADDPTRMLRAVRFRLRLGLRVEVRTTELLARAAEEKRLASLSGARLRNELRRIFAVAPAQALGALQEDGLLAAMDLPQATDLAVERAGRVSCAGTALGIELDGVTAMVACLGLYASGAAVKPEELGERLMLDGGERAGLAQACRLSEQPPQALRGDGADSDLFSALEGTGAAGALACWAATTREERERLERWWLELRGTVADVSGEDLISAGFEAGPRFAGALRAALAAKIDAGADRAAQMRAATDALSRTEG